MHQTIRNVCGKGKCHRLAEIILPPSPREEDATGKLRVDLSVGPLHKPLDDGL
jgi:hypothetical protein